MQKHTIFIKYWKSFLIVLIILTLCLIPSKELRKMDFLKIKFEDLAVHLIMFIAFSVLLCIDMKKQFPKPGKRRPISLIVLTAGTLLGLTTEILQYIFTTLNRTANPVDFLSDIAGTLAGIGLVKLIKK